MVQSGLESSDFPRSQLAHLALLCDQAKSPQTDYFAQYLPLHDHPTAPKDASSLHLHHTPQAPVLPKARVLASVSLPCDGGVRQVQLPS